MSSSSSSSIRFVRGSAPPVACDISAFGRTHRLIQCCCRTTILRRRSRAPPPPRPIRRGHTCTATHTRNCFGEICFIPVICIYLFIYFWGVGQSPAFVRLFSTAPLLQRVHPRPCLSSTCFVVLSVRCSGGNILSLTPFTLFLPSSLRNFRVFH